MITKPLFRYSSLNAGALCRLFREPDVYAPSCDDHTDPKDIMRFIDNALASDVIHILGTSPRHEAYIFAPNHNITTYLMHIGVTKSWRGAMALKHCLEAFRWIFTNTKCRSIMAIIRHKNRGAIRAARYIGMRLVGVLGGSAEYNGELCDEVIYQITFSEFNRLWADAKEV